MAGNQQTSRKQPPEISEKRSQPLEASILVFKLFSSEYYAALISLALLCSLLYYTIKFYSEKLFDFMLFVTVWLQLELAYRQWWLEMRHREPYPVFEHFELGESQELVNGIAIIPPFIKFYFTNAGGSPAHHVYVRVIAIRKEFDAILSVLGRKAQILKRVPQRVCYTKSRREFIPPGGRAAIPIELRDIENRAQDNEQILYTSCYQSVQGAETCTQILEITLLGKDIWIYRIFSPREEPPGLISRSPNLVKDVLLYYWAYRVGRRQ